MTEKSKLLNKEVGLSTALGAGLGLAHGLKNNKTVSSTLLGAGIGALVGVFGQSLLGAGNNPEQNDSDKNSNPAPSMDNQQD